MGIKQAAKKILLSDRHTKVAEPGSHLAASYQTLLDYVVKGLPPPPPHDVKMATIALYQKESGYSIFIETGTLAGLTVESASHVFKVCHSIELSKVHFEMATKRLKNKSNVHLHFGSSEVELPKLVNKLKKPAIIWLDAHFSGDNTAGEGHDPLRNELKILVKNASKKNIILIDDARGLGITNAELRHFIKQFGKDYNASVLNDSVRIVPKNIPVYGQQYSV